MQKYSSEFHAKDEIKRLIRMAEVLFQKGDYKEAAELLERATIETRQFWDKNYD